MRSFKEYVKESAEVASSQTMDNCNEEGQEGQETLDAENLAKKIAEAYHGRSNMDMLRNILQEAERSKRAGTLSNAELDSFYQTFSPMLDGFQRKKLRSIIEDLKKI